MKNTMKKVIVSLVAIIFVVLTIALIAKPMFALKTEKDIESEYGFVVSTGFEVGDSYMFIAYDANGNKYEVVVPTFGAEKNVTCIYEVEG